MISVLRWQRKTKHHPAHGSLISHRRSVKLKSADWESYSYLSTLFYTSVLLFGALWMEIWTPGKALILLAHKVHVQFGPRGAEEVEHSGFVDSLPGWGSLFVLMTHGKLNWLPVPHHLHRDAPQRHAANQRSPVSAAHSVIYGGCCGG